MKGTHKRCFTEEAIQKFVEKLNNEDWEEVYKIQHEQVDKQWVMFINN